MFLYEWHQRAGTRFVDVTGVPVPADYGDVAAEYQVLSASAGVLDLSGRGRVCAVGTDRQRFLNGQFTNDLSRLKPGQGCYAALATAKGRMDSDLGVVMLPDEILLDFEPGLTQRVLQRLERYVIADDVQLVDVSADVALFSIQGPQHERIALAMGWGDAMPKEAFSSCAGGWPGNADLSAVSSDPDQSPEAKTDVILVRRNRFGLLGFDVVAPAAIALEVWERLVGAAISCGGRAVGFHASEWVRVENGIPRYGADMDDTNLVPETGIEGAAISYSKGCYIGQEVIARIRTYGQVTRALRRLEFDASLSAPPAPGTRLQQDGREVGWVTSAVRSPRSGTLLGLGYVRKECNSVGQELALATPEGERAVRIIGLPGTVL